MNFDKIKELELKKSKNIYIKSFILSSVTTFFIVLIILDIGKVAGNSMFPTLKDGDIELSVTASLCNIKKGDIVNINSKVLNQSIVKRVIATEGDTLEIKNNIIYLNGEVLVENYLSEENIIYEDLYIVIPKNCYFVMGDNRNNSVDSRKIGLIKRQEIRSKLFYHSK